MAKRTVWWKQFVVAALCSAMASLLIVAVGPGFSKSDNASDKGAENSASNNGHGNDDKGSSAAPASNAGGNSTSNGNGNGNSDHDGDADNSTSTATEDSHDAEPGTADNRHPSGKDRSEEKGGSGNQGKAESNPDDSKGPERFEGGRGDDKPGGPGGVDRDDQDGNNGCGNDDDFDDDNNGHCGKPSSPPPNNPSVDCTGDTNPNNNQSCDKGDNTPKKITICHATGSESNPWVVITISENAWPAHQAHGDMNPVPAGGCPQGSTTQDGKVTICHFTSSEKNPFVVITVSVNAWPAHQAHGDMLWNGQSCGGGTTTNPPNPNVDADLCPAGTDMAGEPMPGNNVKSCDKGDDGTPPDVVLGDDLENKDDDKPKVDDEVLADTEERERGETLPFTGANIIAYLVLALELVGAGFLISRARKRP